MFYKYDDRKKKYHYSFLNSSDPIKVINELASSSIFPSSTSNPPSLFLIISTGPVQGKLTQGTPTEMASMITLPKGSYLELKT